MIGVEYMITPKLYDTLDQEERKLWHSHEYEVILDFACSSFVLFIFRKMLKCKHIGQERNAHSSKPHRPRCGMGDPRDGRDERGGGLVWQDVAFLAG